MGLIRGLPGESVMSFLETGFEPMFGNILKGWFGEKATQLGMWCWLDSSVYHRFHDVIVPSRNGTTQVDHVLVSTFGIFVIETKNYRGWIFGDEQSPNDLPEMRLRSRRADRPQRAQRGKALPRLPALPEVPVHARTGEMNRRHSFLIHSLSSGAGLS